MITVKSSDSFVANQSSVLSTIGQSLKQARLDCDLSLDEISAKTHISTRYLKAIEDGALHELPEPVYVRGFLRRYCNAVSAPDISEDFPITMAEYQKHWNNASSTELRPLHLYAVYVAVVMGSVTALASFLTPPQTAKITDSETKFGKSAQLEPTPNKNNTTKPKRRNWVPTLEGIEVLRQSGTQFAIADGTNTNKNDNSGNNLINNTTVNTKTDNSAVNSEVFAATGDITNATNNGNASITAGIFRRIVSTTDSNKQNPSEATSRESFAEANIGLGTFLNDWSSRTSITRTTNEEQLAGSFEFSPNKPLNVGIITTGSSWLRVLVDDKTVFEGVAPEGKQFSWSGDQKISVRAGNAGAVMLAFNSKNARRLGKEGDVIEKRFGSDAANASENRVSNNPNSSSSDALSRESANNISPRTFR